VKVDAKQLPADAEYKGYETVVVQDIQIKTENVLFRKEIGLTQLKESE
jgi:hypothetical protein